MGAVNREAIQVYHSECPTMSLIMRVPHGRDWHEHYGLQTYQKLFTCDGCKMKGFGSRYVCKLNGRELHTECRNPKNNITHYNFPGSTFLFQETPFTRTNKKGRKEFSKCCDACGKDVCGFSYHCEADNLDLHICCSKLQGKLIMNEVVFNLEARASSKCMRCRKKKISDGTRDVPGWAYASACGKYHLYVFCMTEMVHEAYMKNGDMCLDGVDLREVVRSKRTWGIGSGSMVSQKIKSVLKIILVVLLGDPTLLISNVLVELVACGLQ